MKTSKKTTKAAIWIVITVVGIAALILSDWSNFKAGIGQKPPVEQSKK